MSIKIKKRTETYGTKCVNCGYCISFCPVEAVIHSEKGIFFNQSKCKAPVCQNCIVRCIVNALEISSIYQEVK